MRQAVEPDLYPPVGGINYARKAPRTVERKLVRHAIAVPIIIAALTATLHRRLRRQQQLQQYLDVDRDRRRRARFARTSPTCSPQPALSNSSIRAPPRRRT